MTLGALKLQKSSWKPCDLSMVCLLLLIFLWLSMVGRAMQVILKRSFQISTYLGQNQGKSVVQPGFAQKSASLVGRGSRCHMTWAWGLLCQTAGTGTLLPGGDGEATAAPGQKQGPDVMLQEAILVLHKLQESFYLNVKLRKPNRKKKKDCMRRRAGQQGTAHQVQIIVGHKFTA